MEEAGSRCQRLSRGALASVGLEINIRAHVDGDRRRWSDTISEGVETRRSEHEPGRSGMGVSKRKYL